MKITVGTLRITDNIDDAVKNAVWFLYPNIKKPSESLVKKYDKDMKDFINKRYMIVTQKVRITKSTYNM